VSFVGRIMHSEFMLMLKMVSTGANVDNGSIQVNSFEWILQLPDITYRGFCFCVYVIVL
jgi:hypothetical protein